MANASSPPPPGGNESKSDYIYRVFLAVCTLCGKRWGGHTSTGHCLFQSTKWKPVPSEDYITKQIEDQRARQEEGHIRVLRMVVPPWHQV